MAIINITNTEGHDIQVYYDGRMVTLTPGQTMNSIDDSLLLLFPGGRKYDMAQLGPGIPEITPSTGWVAPIGNTSKSSFDPSTVTLSELAQKFAALLNDFNASGLVEFSVAPGVSETITLDSSNVHFGQASYGMSYFILTSSVWSAYTLPGISGGPSYFLATISTTGAFPTVSSGSALDSTTTYTIYQLGPSDYGMALSYGQAGLVFSDTGSGSMTVTLQP